MGPLPLGGPPPLALGRPSDRTGGDDLGRRLKGGQIERVRGYKGERKNRPLEALGRCPWPRPLGRGPWHRPWHRPVPLGARVTAAAEVGVLWKNGHDGCTIVEEEQRVVPRGKNSTSFSSSSSSCCCISSCHHEKKKGGSTQR